MATCQTRALRFRFRSIVFECIKGALVSAQIPTPGLLASFPGADMRHNWHSTVDKACQEGSCSRAILQLNAIHSLQPCGWLLTAYFAAGTSQLCCRHSSVLRQQLAVREPLAHPATGQALTICAMSAKNSRCAQARVLSSPDWKRTWLQPHKAHQLQYAASLTQRELMAYDLGLKLFPARFQCDVCGADDKGLQPLGDDVLQLERRPACHCAERLHPQIILGQRDGGLAHKPQANVACAPAYCQWLPASLGTCHTLRYRLR